MHGSLLDFLQEYKIPFATDNRKHGRVGWVQIRDCPRCGSPNFHLGIKLDASRANCYKCGGFNVYKLLREITRAPHQTLKTVVSERIYTHPIVATPATGKYAPPGGLGPLMPMHRDYLAARGLDPDYCASVWGAQGLGPWAESRYRFRVFLPIVTESGQPVSWIARAVAGQEPRYEAAPADRKLIDEKSMIAGMQFVRDTIIVVEGLLDAIKVGPGAGATLGTGVTIPQINILASIPRRIICFDNSKAAQAKAARIAEQLAVFPGETIRVNLKADDPGSASQEEIRELRSFAFGE